MLSGDDVATAIPNLVQRALPFPPAQAILNGGNNLTSPPGILGQLFGSFALPRLDIRVSLNWILRRPDGTAMAEGSDFVAPAGLMSSTVSLAIPPVFRELRLDTINNPLAGSAVYCLFAAVRLTLGTRSVSFELGGIPLTLMPLLVPTVVAMFSEPNFDVTHESAVIILVPQHSALTSAQALFDTLRKIENTLDSVRTIARIATWLLGLSSLVSSVPEQPRTRLAIAKSHQGNGIGFLDRITLKRRPWYHFLSNDPNAEDKISSIIILGLPGTRVEFYNSRSYNTTEGHYSIVLDAMCFAMFRDLDTPTTSEPRTFPPNLVVDWNQDVQHTSWDGRLSSVRFGSDWIRVVDAEVADPPGIPIARCPRIPRVDRPDPVVIVSFFEPKPEPAGGSAS